jgi:hypothetical protein
LKIKMRQLKKNLIAMRTKQTQKTQRKYIFLASFAVKMLSVNARESVQIYSKGRSNILSYNRNLSDIFAIRLQSPRVRHCEKTLFSPYSNNKTTEIKRSRLLRRHLAMTLFVMFLHSIVFIRKLKYTVNKVSSRWDLSVIAGILRMSYRRNIQIETIDYQSQRRQKSRRDDTLLTVYFSLRSEKQLVVNHIVDNLLYNDAFCNTTNKRHSVFSFGTKRPFAMTDFSWFDRYTSFALNLFNEGLARVFKYIRGGVYYKPYVFVRNN